MKLGSRLQMGQKNFIFGWGYPKMGQITQKNRVRDKKMKKKKEPNSIGRLDFYPKPQIRHADRSRASYEPCSAKSGDPGGV